MAALFQVSKQLFDSVLARVFNDFISILGIGFSLKNVIIDDVLKDVGEIVLYYFRFSNLIVDGERG